MNKKFVFPEFVQVKIKFRTVIILITIVITTCLYLLYLYMDVFWETNPHKWITPRKIHNYFEKVRSLNEIGLIVNTSNCKIPDFSPRDPTMIPFIKKVIPIVNCKEISHDWTRIEGNELILNTDKMKKAGTFVGQQLKASCCYKSIRRSEQSLDDYDRDADTRVDLSSCIPLLNERTKLFVEFIMVRCFWVKATETNVSSSTLRPEESESGNNEDDDEFLTTPSPKEIEPSWEPKDVKMPYLAFHAINSQDRLLHMPKSTQDKIIFWQERSAKETTEADRLDRPPNILIIGQDSTSRLNFRRHMPKTIKVLEELGAIEILGYTKAGDHTYSNFCPLLFGYTEEELLDICLFDEETTSYDGCPSIWKRLDEAKYLTGHIEDNPFLNAFNLQKTGFVVKPVDFYPRPMFLVANQHDNKACIGHQTSDEAITTYVESIMDLSAKNEAPIFSLSWSTTASHGEHINGLQLTDGTYSQMLTSLIKKGYMNDTILIVMSDHGYRYGPVRETLIGYFEDKLPNLWIYLPPRIQEKYPKWQEALEVNSRRLTSPYTLYWTFNKILDEFTGTASPVDSVNNETEATMPRQHRQTFFETLNESSTCEDFGIPDIYCACNQIDQVELNDPLLIKGATKSILTVNQGILTPHPNCSPLEIEEITAGAVLYMSLKINDKMPDLLFKRFIVSFTTTPGDFVFEGEINYFPQNRSFSPKAEVLRASKINVEHVHCTDDEELKLFCFCKP